MANLSYFFFLRQGFSVALEPVLELALVDQADLELTEIHLPLPPKCWGLKAFATTTQLHHNSLKVSLWFGVRPQSELLSSL